LKTSKTKPDESFEGHSGR